jgi:hypothetical protein
MKGFLKGRTILILFVITNIVYLTMLFYSIPTLVGYSEGFDIFDMSPFGYNHTEAQRLLGTLGEEGRSFYRDTQLLLDSLYPVLFAATYSLLMLWVINFGQLKFIVWRGLSLLPLLAGVFDYSENYFIFKILASYPEVPERLVSISSALTVSKSMTTTVFFVGLLFAFFAATINRIKDKKAAMKS